MKNTNLFISGIAFCIAANCYAQNLDTNRENATFSQFVEDSKSDFDNFHKQSLNEFLHFVKKPWEKFNALNPIPAPDFQPIPPIEFKGDFVLPQVDCTPTDIDIIATQPIVKEDQPEPITPITTTPQNESQYIDFTFFGTKEKVRIGTNKMPTLMGANEHAVALMLQELSTTKNDLLISDCFKIREKRKLSDWAYFHMLSAISEALYSTQPNEAQILLSYLILQSGYKMRMATNGSRLYMLFACESTIYERPSYNVNGYKYYGLTDLPMELFICQVAYPGEKALSLQITDQQDLDFIPTDSRTLSSDKYPEINIAVSVNKNLLDLYSSYPISADHNNRMTQWATYANAPLDSHVATKLYPELQRLLSNKTELEAANILLNLIQTGLEYEYDQNIWGKDRIFFAEETLFYPYCDCEDRAILLTRLVRDLLGLKCLLVYYPGHLATAIEFSDRNIPGDHISIDGHKYVIADPTYFNAPVGASMPDIDTNSAKIILLN